jgi:hypothetical protein
VTTHESNAATSRRAARRGDEQDARVVTMLQELAPQLDVEPDPEYLRAARQRLVAMAAVRTPEPVRPSPLRRLLAARAVDAPAGRWRTRATAGLAGAALTVTSLATLVALSTGARPGDVLYGVKRGTEQTQLALAGDSRGQTLLGLARARLDEVAAVDGDAALIRSTLTTMDDQTTEGASWYLARALDSADAARLDRLADWTTEQSAQLDAVSSAVPAAAADDVAASRVLLADITERVGDVRSVLDCPTEPDIDGADRLGPVPAGCVPVSAAPQSPIEPTAPGGPAPSGPSAGAAPSAPTASPTAPGANSTTPAAPTGAQPAPAPGAAPSPAPGNPSMPVQPPAGPSSPSGGLLPKVPDLLPPFSPQPTPDLPASPSAAPKQQPIERPSSPLPLSVCVGQVLHLGEC